MHQATHKEREEFVTTTKVICASCREEFEFEDNGSVDCMPDGCFLKGSWYCDDCIRDEQGNLKPEFT